MPPNKEKTLIIGAGEIGKSLKEVFDSFYEVSIRDKNDEIRGTFRVIHICYPYHKEFIETTKSYIRQYKPELVIIHSTVPPGTTRKVASIAVHSPVNGKHPNLAQSIITFPKFIGGTNAYSTFQAVEFLNYTGIVTKVFASPETTELAKILCTTQYGWNIVMMREIERLCGEWNVPFQEVYTEWNNSYNESYAKMGEYRFMRNVLFPMKGPIGGHCVVPNCDLLPDFFTDLVKERNKTYSKEK